MAVDSPWPHSSLKRFLDLLGSMLLLLLLWPLMIVIALGVFISLGKPVIFRQERPGKNGRIFHLCKFRTLKGTETDTEKPGGKIPPNAFTKLIRFCGLDELPELWNIVKGDMSFVGPRPLLVRYLERYSDEQNRRHNVLPGLTGLAQVKGRNAVDWEERLKWDVLYVEKSTLQMDATILWQTLTLIGRGEGANVSSEFLGTDNETH